jgi:alanyl-tRNA synthetase
MKISGKTVDYKIVVDEVFEFIDTHGLPLDYVLTYLHERNMEMDWLAFFLDAKKAGWNISTIKSKSMAAVADAFGGRSVRTLAINDRIAKALDPFL